MVDVKPIRTKKGYKEALAERRQLMARGIAEGKLSERDADKLEVLTALVNDYESRSLPRNGHPVDFLQAFMERNGKTQADFARLIDDRSVASLILNRKRTMSLEVIGKLVAGWGVPAAPLVVGMLPLVEKRTARRSRKIAAAKAKPDRKRAAKK